MKLAPGLMEVVRNPRRALRVKADAARFFERQIMKRASRLGLILIASAIVLAGCRRQGQQETFTLPQPANNGAASASIEKNYYADVVARGAPAGGTLRAAHRR